MGFPAIFLVVAKILFLVYNWWKLCKRLNVKPWYGLFNTLFPIYFLQKASIKFSLYSGKWNCSTRVQVMFLVLSQIFMIKKKILWTYLIFNIKLQLNWHFKSVNQGDQKDCKKFYTKQVCVWICLVCRFNTRFSWQW